MTLTLNRSSSSSSSSLSWLSSPGSLPSHLSTSFSSTTTHLHPLQDIVFHKRLKRKRSPSSPESLKSDHHAHSRPEPVEVLIKAEEQNQNQEKKLGQEQGLGQKRGLGQKQEPGQTQEQECHTEQGPSQSLSTCLTLLNDVHGTHLPQASSAPFTDPIVTTFNPKPQPPIPTSSHYEDQGTQTDLELPLTETYLNWSGRGRSPFKTPAIAAVIDSIKKGAKWVEGLERLVIKEQTELEKVIQLR